MSNITSFPSYANVTAVLEDANLRLQAADTHGLLCGLICISSNGKTHWQKLVLGKKKSVSALEVLTQLYEVSYHQLSEFSVEFNLLLPEDSQDINTRTEALAFWCQGFLTGLNQKETSIDNMASAEVLEALNDIAEITQVNYEDIDESEEAETSYFELVEYVRLAVLMIYQEFKSSSANNNDLLLP